MDNEAQTKIDAVAQLPMAAMRDADEAEHCNECGCQLLADEVEFGRCNPCNAAIETDDGFFV